MRPPFRRAKEEVEHFREFQLSRSPGIGSGNRFPGVTAVHNHVFTALLISRPWGTDVPLPLT